MKQSYPFLLMLSLLALPCFAIAQDLSKTEAFVDKAVWFVVPALALVVIVLMVRNRRRIANQTEDEEG